jgi:hypothetical protein
MVSALPFLSLAMMSIAYLDETIYSLGGLERRPSSGALPDVPEPHSISYTDFNDTLSFIGQTQERHITRLSQLSWVGCGDDVYVLECLGKGFIRVSPLDGPKGDDRVY